MAESEVDSLAKDFPDYSRDDTVTPAAFPASDPFPDVTPATGENLPPV